MPLTIYPTRAATQASIDNLQTTIAAVSSSGAYSGQVDWKLAPNGLPTAGYQKLGGVAVSAQLFQTARSVVVPWRFATAANSFISASGNAAVSGSNILLKVASTRQTTALLNAATLTITAMPDYPATRNLGAMGTVGSKFIAIGEGYTNSSSVMGSVYTLDPSEASPAWVPRATMPQAAIRAGLVDDGNSGTYVLGGRSTSEYVSQTASATLNTIQHYDDNSNTFSLLPNVLPVRMSYVRTARRGAAEAFIWPENTSDGTTLVNSGTASGRRIWLWNIAEMSFVELDNFPSNQTYTYPGCMFVDESGRLVVVPANKPSSGARAFRLDPSAPAGSQWTQIDWDAPDEFTLATLPSSYTGGVTSDGLQLTVIGSVPVLTKCVTVTDYTQLILQAKI